MKLLSLFMIVGLLQVHAVGVSQKVTLDVHQASLTEVFKEIKKQTGFVFWFDESLVKQAQPVSLQVSDMPLDQALKACLKDQQLAFAIEKKVIVITSSSASSREKVEDILPPGPIKIFVTGEDGQALTGATITIKKSKNTGVTNAEGVSTLNLEAGDVVTISYVGYESQEITIKNTSSLTISLKPKDASLQEVVLNKGYYTEKQRLSIGNVAVVSGADIAKQPVTNVLQALEGRVPGLVITQKSGVSGSAPKVTLRGLNSLSNSFESPPFYIVDGIPFDATSLTGLADGNAFNTVGVGQGLSPFELLAPSEIESVTVLKDADATAIYGSRGANGVILITTKKGKAGRVQADANLSTGFSRVTRFLPVLNTEQYLMMRREAFRNDGLAPDPNMDFDLTFWDTKRNTNWQKELLGGSTAQFTNANLSLSGGNTNDQFRIHAGYTRQNNVFAGDPTGNRTLSGGLSLTHSSKDKRFNVTFSGNYSNNNNTVGGADLTSAALTLAPDAPALYNADGTLNYAPRNGVGTWINPLFSTKISHVAITDYIAGNLALNYRVFAGLSLSAVVGGNKRLISEHQLTPSTFNPPPDNLNPAYRNNNFINAQRNSWNIEPQANYGRNIGSGRLDVLVGMTFQENSGSSNTVNTSGYASDALLSSPTAASSVILRGSATSLYHYFGIYGSIRYNWKEKYLLNIAARRDGSSRFGPGKQFGNFGSVGAGWVFSKEKFVEDLLPWLSFGKLRSSYGVTGSDNVGNYSFLSTYSPTGFAYQGSVGSLNPSGLTNPYYAWEKNKKLEAGIELGFLQDRIHVSAAWFRNRCGNQLINYTLPNITGYNGVTSNLPAVVQNEGWEFSATTQNIKGQGFNWSSSFNISQTRNKLLAFPGLATSSYNYQYFLDQPLGTTLGYHYLGVDPQIGDYRYSSKNLGLAPTTIDLPPNGDLVYMKPLIPAFSGGFSNTISYKDLTLDIFMQFSKQQGIAVISNGFLQPGKANVNQPVVVLQRWQKPGNLTSIAGFTTQPSIGFGKFYGSDGAVTDASFIRVKTVNLSYALLGHLKKKIGMQQCRIFMNCQNPFTITKYQGDPETQGFVLPPLRVFTAGLQVSL